MSAVVVVGGGIAGLAAARELARAGVGQVSVLEASSRWGGKIAPALVGGMRLDVGAESVLARRPEALRLMDELEMTDRITHPTDAKSQVLLGGRVHRLPPSAMGVPRDLDELDGYLSAGGMRRAREEPALPAPPLESDVTIGDYVDDRFGAEVTDRLLEPLLGGVYAGKARLLSFDAVAHPLFLRARGGGSLLEHAREMTATTASGPVFAGLAGGVATLVDTLLGELDRLKVTLRSQVTVRELSRRTGGGYRLVCGPAPAPETFDADAVLLAAPAGATGRLLSELAAVGAELAEIPYASLAVVTLVVRGAALTGSGILVPPGELPTVKALTYSSNKWDWVARQADPGWGSDTSVVRASVGRFQEAHLLQMDDAGLLRRTFSEVAGLPGWDGARLLTGHVARWGGALPQYLVGHRELVARLRASLNQLPGLAVAGAALEGVGIPACLASAQQAVSKITTDLSRTPDLHTPLERTR